MTVVVNAVAAKMGGAATYLRELVRELARVPEADRFIFYVPPEQADPGLALSPHLEWRVSRAGHRGALGRLWWDQVTLRRILRRERADVLYSTANFALFLCPVPQLLLVRDALYFSDLYQTRFLAHKPLRHRLAFALRRWLVQRSAVWADRTIAPSETLAQEVRRCQHQAQVTAIRYGRSTAGPSGTEPPQPGTLLYVSHYADHKNFTVLLAAMEILEQERPGYFRLTCTADIEDRRYPYSASRAQDRRLAQRLESRGLVRFLGDVSAAERERLYRTSSIFVFPSLCESFGQPLVEAMSYGLPVTCADTPINREIGREAVLYFHSDEPRDLAAKILEVEFSETLSRHFREQAWKRAQTFSWASHAAALQRCWAELAGARKSSAER